MKIKAVDTFAITLPFRFAFGHSLATRADSTNLIVRVTLEDGTQGFGEGVPRDYVTGEDAQSARRNVERKYAPEVIGLDVSAQNVTETLAALFKQFQLDKTPAGASFCAFELAVLDAVGKSQKKTIADLLGPVRTPRIRYGGVIPFGGKKAVLGMLWFYKLYGFKTVKLKVGKTLDDDIKLVAMARKIMGDDATIRVDANCAWTADQTLRAAEAFRPYRVASYEQPVPADNLTGLKKITSAISEKVLVDESLCTIEQATDLAENRICSAFNIRISKAGGLLAAREMVKIATANNIEIHMGAQVGESGILSAAARNFATLNEPFANYEGSMNSFLLKTDLTAENLTVVPGGLGDLSYAANKPGLGISVLPHKLNSFRHINNESLTEVHARA